jgi:hypothetical protein
MFACEADQSTPSARNQWPDHSLHSVARQQPSITPFSPDEAVPRNRAFVRQALVQGTEAKEFCGEP